MHHGTDVPLIFGTYPASSATAQQVALSKYMQGAWADFAKNPALGPGWNQVGSFGGLDLGVLGSNGSSGVTLIKAEQVDYRCGLYAEIYEAQSRP